MADELSDEQVWSRLQVARDALGQEKAASVAADTAMEAARRALLLLQMGVLKSSEDARDRGEPSPGQIPDPR